MKYKIRTALLLTVLLTVLGGLMPVYGSIPEPAADYYASDLANVLSDSTIDYIVEKNIALENKSGAQIVVVTVDFAGNDIESFGYDLFNDWGIGSASEDNGVLILLAIGDDDWFGVAGTGLERVISSGTMNNLLWDYLDDDFSIGDYDAGVIKVFDAVYDILDKHYGVYDQGSSNPDNVGGTAGTTGGSTAAPPPQSSGSNSGSGFIIFLIVLIIVFCVLVSLLRPRRRYRARPTYYGVGVPVYPVRRRRWWQRRPPPPPPYHPHHPPHPPRGPVHGTPPRMSAGSPPKPAPGPARGPAPKPAAPKTSSGGLFSGGGGSTRGGGVSRSSSSRPASSTPKSSGGSISRPSGSSGGGISRSSGGSSRSSGSSSRSSGGSFRGGGGSTRGGGSSRGGGRK